MGAAATTAADVDNSNCSLGARDLVAVIRGPWRRPGSAPPPSAAEAAFRCAPGAPAPFGGLLGRLPWLWVAVAAGASVPACLFCTPKAPTSGMVFTTVLTHQTGELRPSKSPEQLQEAAGLRRRGGSPPRPTGRAVRHDARQRARLTPRIAADDSDSVCRDGVGHGCPRRPRRGPPTADGGAIVDAPAAAVDAKRADATDSSRRQRQPLRRRRRLRLRKPAPTSPTHRQRWSGRGWSSRRGGCGAGSSDFASLGPPGGAILTAAPSPWCRRARPRRRRVGPGMWGWGGGKRHRNDPRPLGETVGEGGARGGGRGQLPSDSSRARACAFAWGVRHGGCCAAGTGGGRGDRLL